MEKSRDGRKTQTRYAPPESPGRAKQRAFMVAAAPQADDLAELRELLRTAGVATVGEVVQIRDKPHANLYLGPGKVDEIKARLKAADANVVVADDELTPRQQRNLEAELDLPVLDRTAVILDIFAGHAHSAEGKLQVELAQLEYNMARMRGLWTHLERLGAGRGVGGIGTRGPGESQIETDRRLARDRITALRRRLDHVRSNRAVQRAERERAHLPSVALAGYTNAGKSTLLNAMTGSEVGVRDRLFHTLDPTTRTLRLQGRTYLMTDTVGFIRKLPHQLVDAFAATLEETKRADLLLHVVDASAPEEELVEMTKAVEDVLEEIGVGDQPRILVLNKADLLDDDRRLARDRITALRRRLDHVRSNRAIQRAERERAHLPSVALAGYTNAGKSTLLNAMTGSEVGVRDRLFHTLDPTTRTLRLQGRTYLMTDTVGFIRKLPHQLVDAFAATLEETKRADLLLHVVDASAPEEELVAMIRAVDDVLEEIGVGDQPRILVLNKADKLTDERRHELAFRHADASLVSAITGEGLEELQERIADEFERQMRDVELLVPFSEGGTLSELHDVAGDLERTDTPDGVRVLARLPAVIAERFDRYAVNGRG
ncbi:MAG TPA: GTPase HflX [Solirubrobacteraceae bacterium]